MRWARRIASTILVLLLLAGLALLIADTSIGHRFIEGRINALTPKSGLRIHVKGIEGSIYGKARVGSIILSDPQGSFFEAYRADLDWTPASWLDNRLDIKTLIVPEAKLSRLPKLKPGEKGKPLLPGFDIEIGNLEIAKLKIAQGVAGPAREGRLAGKASIRAGRALIDLGVDAGAGDRLALKLDAEPDRNRFDLDGQITAPAQGLFGTLAGTVRPFEAVISGAGSYKDWKGQLALTVSGAKAADLALTQREGLFGLDGQLRVQGLTQGKLQRLTAPIVTVKGEGRLAERRLSGSLQLASAALAARATGTLDLKDSRFAPVLVEARLAQPAALFPNMAGVPPLLKLRLDGPFATASFDYLLTTPLLQFDQTGLEDVRASGQGRLSKPPVRVPLSFSARRITGVGDVAGGILSNLTAKGELAVTAALITGDGIAVQSDKFNGRVGLMIDLKTGVFDVGIMGALTRYRIPGLGIVDVKTDLRVNPSGTGTGSRVTGRGQAWVRQWENNFLAGLAQGLPVLETGLARGPDGNLELIGLTIKSPGLTLSGNGVRRRDGSFHFEGSGRQARYGPLKLVLEGRIERPQLEITLASPADGMGLSNVKLLLDPEAQGYRWRAEGGSTLGRFTGNGLILMPPGGQTVIEIEQLRASNMIAKGRIVPQDDALTGRLELSGGGTSGTLILLPQGRIQRIDAKLRFRDARFEGPPPISIRRGQFDGTILLDPAGTRIDGTMTGEGMERGTIRLSRLAANLKMSGDTREIRAQFSGARGRSFDLQTVARGRGDVWEVEGGGTVDRKPLRLLETARVSRESGGWRLAPARLSFAGGQATIGGLFGGESTAFQAKLAAMPLAITDMISPGLGLGGTATGSVDYRFARGGSPEGKADLRIRGLTRSGLVLSSAPVDMGITAQLTAGNAGIRAIAMSGGKEIGRAQARLTPGAGPDLVSRLSNAPVFAQVRYSGAADILWRLTGIESFDVTGGILLAADVNGRVDDPVIRGSLKTTTARIESAVTGMVLTQVAGSARFVGDSRLVIDSLTARSPGGGIVGARGEIDLSSARGFGMDLVLDTNSARLIERDELAATVTGPLRLRSQGGQGIISGDVVLDRSRYRLGRTTAVQSIPTLKVREINRPDDDAPVRLATLPWQLDLKARAPARLMVSGLGLESEWRATMDIGGTVVAPRITGRADLLRGDYEFAGRNFKVSRGVIRFLGESPPDPVLDITAEGSTQDVNATIRVTGTGLKPNIAFSSVPSLPEDELLSRMLFGTSIANLSAPEAVQLATAVAALRGGGDGLNPINALRKAIGLDRLRILPADTVTGQRTSVSAGKYITRRAYVEVVTDGAGYSATRAEFQVTRWLSILSSISSIGRQSASVRVTKDY